MPKARLELFDFQEVSDMLKWRNVRSGLKIHIAKANSEIGTIARKALREFMRKGAATRKNKALTIILKGGNKPLFHTGQMANSLQKKRESWHTMRVGFVDDKQVMTRTQTDRDPLSRSLQVCMKVTPSPLPHR